MTADVEQWTVEKPWLSELRCSLGEGPFYENETNSVRFVDIERRQIHTVSANDGPEAPSLKTIQLEVSAGVTADIEGVDPRERILAGIKYGLAVLDRTTGEYQLLKAFRDPHNERLRSNDGAADPRGRFWLGSITDFNLGEFQPEGSLFRFDGTTREEVLRELTIPNAVGWSPDQKTMYFTHTSAGQVLAFDYDADTGAVSNKRVFYEHDGPGGPDGFRVDVDGNIWHAIYGEGLVLKIDRAGRVVGRVSLPTRNITCVQFVGTELVITSAADKREGVSEDDVSKKFGGAVFKLDVGTRGLDLFKFKLKM